MASPSHSGLRYSWISSFSCAVFLKWYNCLCASICFSIFSIHVLFVLQGVWQWWGVPVDRGCWGHPQMAAAGHCREQGKFMSIFHYSDFIMSMMASQITSISMVCSTVLFRHRSKKTSKLHVTSLCEGNSPVTSEFPSQRASNGENVSVWWCHHVVDVFKSIAWCKTAVTPVH